MTRKQAAAPSPLQKLRCAVYTRKSSEEGLEMEFNSLEAQREVLRGVCRQPARRGLDSCSRPLRRWRLLRRHPGAARAQAAAD